MARKLEPLDRLTIGPFFWLQGGGGVADCSLYVLAARNLHIYLLNSIRVIKKPPKWGQGSEVVSVGISRPYLR